MISIFDTIKVPTLIFLIGIIVAFFLYVILGGLIIWDYMMGKSLAPFFTNRIYSWLNPKTAILQIFTLNQTITLEPAYKESGDGYKLSTIQKTHVVKPKKKDLFDKIIERYIPEVQEQKDFISEEPKPKSLILPKSTYTINGVTTIPVLDIHPRLHADIIEGVKILIERGINTIEEFKDFVEAQPNDILFKEYTNKKFLDMYTITKQKYSFSVTTDDVLNFIGKNYDKTYRETIEAKNFNQYQKTKSSNKVSTYGGIAIVIVVIVISFRIIYLTIY